MAHQFDCSGPIVRVTYSGEVTPEDVFAIGQKASEFDRGCTVFPDRLINLLPMTGGQVGYREISDFVANRRRITFPNSYKCAVVASSDLQRGFARMVQTLLDHPQIKLEIFSDVKTAEEWLSAPAPKTDAL